MDVPDGGVDCVSSGRLHSLYSNNKSSNGKSGKSIEKRVGGRSFFLHICYMQTEFVPPSVAHQLQLYTAATFLFSKGKSHPQIIEMLAVHESNPILLTRIVDYAMEEKWDKLYEQARELFALGGDYEEVCRMITAQEDDADIVRWICGSWYEWKTHYMEMLIEGATNRSEGLRGMLIGITATALMFWVKIGWGPKVVCITGTVLCFGLWVVGMHQRRMSALIDRFFIINH